MKKALAYLLSVLFYFFFGLTLLVFHALQWLTFNLFGYQAHKKIVDYLNLTILRCLNVLGTRIEFENEHNLPKNVPHIIVANHQSPYDIPPITWYLRKIHPKFISKKELGKGIPSVSYNLRHGGSILIDRKNPRQALPEIKKFAQYLNKTNRSAVIFPEGTRSRDGMPKRFSPNGLKMLFKFCPDAVIIPVSINNSWKLVKHGSFPLNIGIKVKFRVQKPIFVKDYDIETLILKVEQKIIKDIIHE
ncbi:lysophospholipid acyltransferase family protein [Haloflavibacter putidus]|uniref:1-acyl-sn-glycerol-3-phosphate acyltransferase n=1 Tax=Haloflavibacter putidus TaxID=2576776 RepID=A0A507ZY11_9FLAO|nr:lysophospholipid acyltransferase family protein [Haloflavibacter putidus]TQD40598.1 1-acyl-sn-glycerol-3-phosphate acyltransferase [Haloflavibacter putidus]